MTKCPLKVKNVNKSRVYENNGQIYWVSMGKSNSCGFNNLTVLDTIKIMGITLNNRGLRTGRADSEKCDVVVGVPHKTLRG